MNNLEVAIAGVKIVAKILNFPVPELYIMEQSNLPNQEVTLMIMQWLKASLGHLSVKQSIYRKLNHYQI